MLSEKEIKFIANWESVREQQRSFKFKLLSGLPYAILFSVPVLIFFGVVKIFFPAWFATASHKQTEVVVPGLTEKFMQFSDGDFITTLIAIIILVFFFSYFRMHYKWEMNEQLYQELKFKEKRAANAAL